MTLTLENRVRNAAHIETDSTEILHGFKMTELGLIPEDWEISKIEDLVIFVRAGKTKPKKKIQNSQFLGLPE